MQKTSVFKKSENGCLLEYFICEEDFAPKGCTMGFVSYGIEVREESALGSLSEMRRSITADRERIRLIAVNMAQAGIRPSQIDNILQLDNKKCAV